MTIQAEQVVLDHALARGYVDAAGIASARRVASEQQVSVLQVLAQGLGPQQVQELERIYQAAVGSTLVPPALGETLVPPTQGGAPRPAPPPDESQRFGEYEVVRELARGGMGVVYVGRHTRLDRPVAIKVMAKARAKPEYLERFRVEVEAMARIRHPNIVNIHEAGLEGTTPYFVMELVEGESLIERIRRDGPLDPSQAADIARQLAEALHCAHEQAILHRDMKPSNVLLSPAGPMITDFGLAKDTRNQMGMTTPGQAMGTPLYMSPE